MTDQFRPGDFTRAQIGIPTAVCLAAVALIGWFGPQNFEHLPAMNAILNGIATVLLVVGYVLIKVRRERAHTIAMLAAFGTSVVFLASYVVYHLEAGSRPFTGEGTVRTVYFGILITHIVLAATVPFLAGATIILGFRDRRAAHRRIAVWTFPIWLYVSVTGVVIYLMLYHFYA